MAIVSLVMLMATANVANLMLARGISRQREFAIRMATGAGRSRLVRQLLTETLVLFTLGAIPGIFVAGWSVGFVEGLFAQGRRPIILEADREIRDSFPDDVPEALFPEPGGLHPWAGTDNGDRLYWRTEGNPDSWSVVVWESRGPQYEDYALTMSGFLVAWLQGDVRIPMFPPEDWHPLFEQNPSYGD